MTLHTWNNYRREFGLSYPIAILFVGLHIVAAMTEVLGLGIFLPIFQYVRLEGNIAVLTAQEPLWRVIVPFAQSISLPITLVSLLVIAFSLFIARQLVMYAKTVLMFRTEQWLVRDLKSKLFSEFLGANLAEQERFAAGDIANSISTEASTAIDGLTAPLKFLSACFMSAIYLGLLAFLSVEMTLIAGAIGIIAVIVIRQWFKRTTEISRKLTLSNKAASSYLLQRLNYPRLVRLAATERAERDGLGRLFTKQAGNTIGIGLLKARTEVFLEPIVVGLSCVFLYFAVTSYGWQVEAVGLFMVVSLRLVPILKSIVQQWQAVLRGTGPLERVTETSSKLKAATESLGGSLSLEGFSDSIVFDNVSFSYADADRPVLHDVSLKIPAGKLTALVGPSGSGKSTLIDLIPRLREPDEGRILIDATPVDEFSLTSLRAGISYAPQSSQVFDVTAAQHIGYGREGASIDEIKAAARLAGADKFIAALSKGYDTLVGESGSTLSGGQRQRLDLARALLSGAPILILDEPTSQQDADTERDFRETLARICRETEMTLIVVAHRFSTVAMADQIIVLRNGRVEDIGTHGSLVKKDGWYAKASRKQQDLRSLDEQGTDAVHAV